jgi:3-oxoacyl-[acyl-carrier protein] reductase
MIRTAMTEAMSPKAFEAMEASIPAGRIGEGTDVAQAVAFFADPQSGYTTGQVLAVDGALAV